MKLLALFALMAFLTLGKAMATVEKKRLGLLTDGYGIVTKADLDEEERRVRPSPFPSEDSGDFNYWQCFKHEGYFLGCENQGDVTSEHWDVGEAAFWIRANGKKTEFSTRRNWDIGFCRNMINDILKIIEDQPVVCVSASYGKGEHGEYWVIDRVKTKKGEWSWFARPTKRVRAKKTG